jgi:nucleoid DNA-binding protein
MGAFHRRYRETEPASEGPSGIAQSDLSRGTILGWYRSGDPRCLAITGRVRACTGCKSRRSAGAAATPVSSTVRRKAVWGDRRPRRNASLAAELIPPAPPPPPAPGGRDLQARPDDTFRLQTPENASIGKSMTKAGTATAMSKAESEAIVEAILAGITHSLLRGEKVEIRGFGTFGVRQRKSPHGAQFEEGARPWRCRPRGWHCVRWSPDRHRRTFVA